ncbi:MAG: SDR family NAD(P)-dependent oxidoreductase [Pseudomonadota bacterium]|nr:MAG: SDR family NAD(P)-dependent oxidoreductase [Pseudomonadota bacterium]
MAKPTCVVVGVGPGNGAAFARRFGREGFRVALLARNLDYLQTLAAEIPDSRAYAYDVADTASAPQIFRQIKADLGPVEVLIYNAGAGKFAPIDNASPQDFESAWRVNALGCAVACQQVIPDMRAAKRGHIVIIGATASVKSGAHSAPFASAKAAQRGLAQSMARHLGPDGIHVAYVILDGVVNLARTRQAMPDKPDEFFMQSSDIAESVFFLTRQPRSAWSFEIDLRPFGERW